MNGRSQMQGGKNWILPKEMQTSSPVTLIGWKSGKTGGRGVGAKRMRMPQTVFAGIFQGLKFLKWLLYTPYSLFQMIFLLCALFM
jgi:hypothetical protein